MKEKLILGSKKEVVKEEDPWMKGNKEWKIRVGYRLAEDEERSCKACKYRIRIKYHGKSFNKCEKLGLSHSEATDIRLKCICNLYEKGESRVYDADYGYWIK